MCLGIPGQVVEIVDAEQSLAKVDVNGVRRNISVRLLADDNLQIGDWVLVHVGFAMAKIDEREAETDAGSGAEDGRRLRQRDRSLHPSRDQLRARNRLRQRGPP